jgi:AraC-like DNA-binding protein
VPHAVSDFASGAMVRLLVAGAARAGLALPPAPPAALGHVPLDAKRVLIEAAVAQAGPAALLQLGQGIDALRGDPVHQVLAAARGPLDFVQRWQRLERYIHSRHRIALLESGPRRLRLQHHALRAGEAPPTAGEDLLVLGVVAAGCTLAGAQGLAVASGGVALLPHTDTAGLAARLRGDGVATWELHWQAEQPLPPAAEGPCPTDLCEPIAWPATAHRIATTLLADPSIDLRPAALAARLGTTPRTLQRRLAEGGTTLGAVVAEARCRAAAWWLRDGTRPLAEIGYLCGFADQPHFTRSFRARVGLTPARYRAQARGPAGPVPAPPRPGPAR